MTSVLMTADAVGGVWSYAVDVSAGLAAAGLSVTLAVLGPSPTQAQRRQIASGVAVMDTVLPLDWLADSDALDVAGSALAALATRSGAAVIHLNHPSYAAVTTFAVPVVGLCHSCVATWWDAVRCGALPEDFRGRRALLARGYAACDALVAPSHAFAAATAGCYGVLPRVVANGRHAGGRVPGSAKEPFALTSGRLWDDGKNVAALDCAAARMRGTVRAAGPLQGPSGAAAALDAIVPLGLLDDAAMTAWLNRAAVFASLARYEPFGLGVLEAAQSGCALVLSDIPTFRELWDDAALFVAADDAAAVAAVLDALLDDPNETTRLGRLAAARAVRFDMARAVAGTLAVYRDLGVVRLEAAA